MNFAIDGTLWEDGSPDGYDILAASMLRGLEGLGHHFRFLGRSRIVCPAGLSGNVQWAKIDKKAEDWLFPSGWTTRSVPRALKSGDPATWVSFSGQSLPGAQLPAKTGPDGSSKPRQWIFLKEIASLLWPEAGKEGEDLPRAVVQGFRKKWGGTLSEPTAGVIVFSARAAELLSGSFGVEKARIHVLPAYFGPGPGPASWEDRETAKWAYSDGKDYFLWTGTLSQDAHWISVLKAFSQFKVRQKSQMRLILAPWHTTDASFHERIETYKYRADVKVLEPGPDTWKNVARGAYALMYTPSFDELGWVAGTALSQGIPLISAEKSVAREWAGDTVAWVNPDSPEAIAEALLRLYKDERYRALVQAEGLTLAGDRVPEKTLRAYEEAFSATA